MLNLNIFQKLNCKSLSVSRNVYHKGPKNSDIHSCVSTSKEKQYHKGVTPTDNFLVTSYPTRPY